MKNNRTNRFISMALAVIMLIGILPMNTLTAFAASSLGVSFSDLKDTDNDGYLEISTPEEFVVFARYINSATVNDVPGAGARVELVENIDLQQLDDGIPEKTNWIPIGANSSPNVYYSGCFNGNGYYISGVKLISNGDVHGSTWTFGLFSQMLGSDMRENVGIIENIVLKNSSFETILDDNFYLGAIIGHVGNYAVIRNCRVEDTVTLTALERAGGISGYTVSATIENCYSAAKINAETLKYVGAIASDITPEQVVLTDTYYTLNGDVKYPIGEQFSEGSNHDGATEIATNGTHTHSVATVAEQKESCLYTGRTLYKFCVICGLSQDNTVNNEIPALGHKFDNVCDTDCNNDGCEYTREVEGHKYGDSNYNELCDPDCNKCGGVRTPEHSYSDSCDTICNLCDAVSTDTSRGHIFSEPGFGRMIVCAVCGGANLDGAFISDATCGVNIELPTKPALADSPVSDTITWSVLSTNNSANAAVSNNILKAENTGSATLRATVSSKGIVKDFTVEFKQGWEINIADGSVTIDKKDDDTVTVKHASLTGGSRDFSVDEPIMIIGTTDKNTITVNSGNTVIIFNNATIETTSFAAMEISGIASVNLQLMGENKLAGSHVGASLGDNGNLTISGDGSLDAGGDESGVFSYYNYANGGNLTIHSGTIKTYGRYGIHNITLTMYGGNVTAEGSSDGISLSNGVSTIYDGILSASAVHDTYGECGITGDSSETKLIVNGGEVTARGKKYAGIGRRSDYGGINVEVNGGTLSAYGGPNSSGIGGSNGGNGGTVTITGGVVYAQGGEESAGIGGGNQGSGGTVTISGGTVTAIAGAEGAGIGGGRSGSGGNVVITGGTVLAKPGKYVYAGIGSGVNMSGGSLTDGNGNSVSLKTITVEDVTAVTKISAVTATEEYGLKDVYTDKDGKLYFYLPAGVNPPASIICNGKTVYFDGDSKYVDHVHQFEYSVNAENKKIINAVCKSSDCYLADSNGGTLKISAPADLYVDGSEKEAVIDNKLVDTEAQISAVTYSTADGKAPTTAGTYTASVTVEGATASVEFTLFNCVATVTIGSETKYYATIDEAWAAANGNTATITLIDNCTTENTLYSNGDLTLDTADYTLTAQTFLVSGGKLTVKGSGELVNTQSGSYCVQVAGGEFVLESGTVSGVNVYSDSADAKATVNGGTVKEGISVSDNSDTYSATFIFNNGTFAGKYFFVNVTPDIQLNGGKFTADSTSISGVSDYTFADILGEGKAYYNANGEMIVLTDGQTKISEPFTVGDIADEIARIKAAVEAYDVDTVTSADIQAIAAIKTDIANVKASAGLTAEQAETLDASDATLDSLVEKLTEVGNEIKRIDEAVTAYDINTVTSDDKADIEQLKADIKTLTDGTNITAKERATLEAHDATLDTLLAKISSTADEIDRIVSVINSYDADTVKSSDKADIQQLIADIKALTDGENITENEKVNLEAFDAQADELIAKINEVAAEITRLEETVNAYDINTVKSSDKADIEQLIADIKALTDGDNITDDERTNLEALDVTLDELLAKISETAAEIARIEETANAYDIDTVKSTDKTAIEQLIADIKALTDGANLADNERLLLDAYKANLEKMVEKIDATAKEIDRINNAVAGYNEDTVKSSDKEAIEQLKDNIQALIDSGNVTEEEIKALEETLADADALTDKIAEVAAEKKRVEDAINGYSEDTVKSSDTEAIEQLKDDIKTLIDSGNVTEEEIKALEETKADADALTDKIDEVAAEKKRIEDAVNGYSEETVKSSDVAAIDKLIEDIKALTDGKNVTDEEKAALEALDATADELNEKIDEVAAEKKRIEDAVNGYSEDTVKSSDTEAIEQLKDDIQALIDSGNVTEEEIKALEETLADANALTDKIDEVAAEKKRIEDAVNGYSEDTVKSSDTEAIEKLKDDIKTLIDSGNVTEEEIKALEETKADADTLTDKIDEVAAEKKRIEDAVNGYSEETVKSSDTEAIEQLKDDIQALIDSGNVTEEEVKALEETKADADALTDKIEETAQAMADTADKADDFDPATVTSDDKDEINGIIADIDEIIASGNATQEEIADLNETKAELNALIEKFSEATAKVEALGAEMEMFDKDRVTKFWEDEIEALIAEIETLLADPNMGTAEKAKLNEYKAQAEEMLEIINTPKEYISCRFFYLIWDCLTWKYNGILWLFSKIFGVA